MFGTQEIMMIVAAAAVLFGAERIPKLARGLGQAKKEFQIGQAEADVEADRLRAEARARAAEPPVTPTATPESVIAPIHAPAPPTATTTPNSGLPS